jgi:Protein of unknown function (DUF4232)
MPARSRAHAASRLVLLALTLLPLAAQAQSACTAADLDITFRFGNYAPSTYIIAVLAKNIAPQACVLSSNTQPRLFNSGHAPIPIQLAPPADAVTIQPNQSAHQAIRWTTTPAPDSPPCQRAAVLTIPLPADPTHPAELLAPTLLPPVCSQVAAEPFALGPTLGDDDSAPNHALPAPNLRLSSYRIAYLPGESFSLHAESGTPTPGSHGMGITRCRPFFLRQRTLAGATRTEEFTSPQIRCMREASPGANAAASAPDPTAYLTIAFGAVIPIQGSTLGDATIQLFSVAGALTDPLLTLTTSNAITLHISDQATPLSTPTLVRSDTPTLVRLDQPIHTTATEPADLNAFTGWQTAFTLTDTSFGKRTALLDQSTHIEWLRLSESRNKSQETLRRNMSPHKVLDGWRFATDDEVATFFRHFTGSPTGRTSDPAIVAELQSLMGGPLATSHSTPGNWTRAITNGRIAGYYAPTSDFAPAGAPRFQYRYATIRQETVNGDTSASITPNITGHIDGDTTSPDTGTFLVREH